MSASTKLHEPAVRSRLSFKPMFDAWQNSAADNNSLSGRVCFQLIKKFQHHPELLQPIDDYGLLTKHQTLVEAAMLSVFPASVNNHKVAFAAVAPFSFKIIYASGLFQKLYADQKRDTIQTFNNQIEKNVMQAYIKLAYTSILSKYYHVRLDGANSFICAYPSPEEGIYNYFELDCSADFIDVYPLIELPVLPSDIFTRCHHINDLFDCAEIFELLPLESFVFEGICIMHLNEVTAKETIKRIEHIINGNAVLESDEVWLQVEKEIKYLLHKPKMLTGFTTFYNESELFIANETIHETLLKRSLISADGGGVVCKAIKEALQQNFFYLWSEENEASVIGDYLKGEGCVSALFLALKINGKLIGWLELLSKDEDGVFALKDVIACKPLTDLLQRVIGIKEVALQTKVDQLVKEYFTAVQPSVEWKFKSTVLAYLAVRQAGGDAKMQSITFENIYPLYGAIDIKNSSLERNRSVQEDIIEQLQWIKNLLMEAQQTLHISIIDAWLLRIDEFINFALGYLTSGNEQAIRNFLKEEAIDFLRNLKTIQPGISKNIDAFYKAINNKNYLLNSHQMQFEESITKINALAVNFMEEEQKVAQTIFPHYFERFITDGVEFNIYIGQSITPDKKFNKLYLKNLKLWQLETMVRAAQKIAMLKKDLPVPLQTTQLILSYNEPLSVRFRSEERKFDVHGVQNVRYEIIKKRIDKAHIKSTGERLVKEGTIAIVYLSASDAKEYLQYIRFLKQQGLLTGETEMLDLEDLQGVNGLKAIRVAILQGEQTADITLQKLESNIAQ